MLDILYRDEYLIAINKPHGLLVHRSAIAADAGEFALQLLRDQVGFKVNPVHRLDRATGGILLFALNKEVEITMQQQFSDNQVQKNYLAIVRGYTADAEEIDYPLRKENGTLQDAFTAYKTLNYADLPVPFGKHETSRYSLIDVKPTTGRMHQIRKHLSHVNHPIIGDTTHGCNKQNKLFREKWDMTTLLLHASRLIFNHPVDNSNITIMAPVNHEFNRVMDLMNW
ncbi:pseudouridine synthase [Mucilaginibacter sp. UR6-11]|uniref:pseudouridine synthase n=1 Tax=Mucilaginibacter sp. UR6-11 TaxID=1435644 RepID=UPI001E37A0C7|nr:pseudouridine synthase [Mucilaginibacter sp. UR6-11]MCC8426250.1 pseudouridine synthase [Mucilaginibacter sp. UR6-11]